MSGRQRAGGAGGMEGKAGGAAAAPGVGFLGLWLDRMRLLLLPLPLPEKLSAKSMRSHVYSNYLGSRRERERWWRWLLLLWVVGWTLASCWILFFMNSQAVEKRRDSLASMCDERARMLQDQFNVSMNHLQALAILVSTFHHSQNPSAIDQTTFARYAERTAFERPLTSGVAYAVRVTHAERDQFEWQPGWSIKQLYSNKKKSPGPGDSATTEIREPAEEYAPVIFAQDAYKHILSFDLLSGHDDRKNIIRSRESGKGVLTAPFKLLNNRLGVISTYTVYKPELPANARPQERIQAAIGYLGGIFDIEALVDKLLHQLAGKQSIMVNVYDTTYERPISMYGSNDTGDGMYHNSTLNFGDPSRRHEMHCRFMQSPPWPWLAITSSLGTLVIALLTGHIFHATVQRIAKVEDDFQNMKTQPKQPEKAFDTMDSASVAPRLMPLHMLEEITDGFSEGRKLGAGSYGNVYKGEQKDGEKVAVKMLHDILGLDDEQFEKEYINIASLQHKNIVQLVGYCHETRREFVPYNGRMVFADRTKRALCFEYMHNGTLENYLSDESNGLDWPTRYAIIKGISEGLKYLHEDLESPMYHLDLKPANVLLDEVMVPKITDFGLSRLFGEGTQMTKSPIGTRGYVPPEYIDADIISSKFDIFSLGVIIIKIMTGPKGYFRSAEMSSQRFVELVHENWNNRLHATSHSEQVKRCIEIALSCVEADRHKRPSIGVIINKLNETESINKLNESEYQ